MLHHLFFIATVILFLRLFKDMWYADSWFASSIIICLWYFKSTSSALTVHRRSNSLNKSFLNDCTQAALFISVPDSSFKFKCMLRLGDNTHICSILFSSTFSSFFWTRLYDQRLAFWICAFLFPGKYERNLSTYFEMISLSPLALA